MVFRRMEARSSDGKKGAGDGTNGCFDDVKEGLDHVPALAADLRVDVAEMLDVVRRAVSEDHLPLHVTPPAVHHAHHAEHRRRLLQ